MSTTFNKPYCDSLWHTDGWGRESLSRTFDPDKDDSEYVWHVDLENREIEVIEGEGWQFQFQDCLPLLLEKGMVFRVNGHEYHRLIKGITPLKCRIYKNV